MTGNRANIPRQNSDLGGGSPPSREWYNFFRRVGDFVNRAELGGNTIVNQGDTIINNGNGSVPVSTNTFYANVQRQAQQSIGAAAWTAVSFDTEGADSGSLFSLSNPTYIEVPSNGIYTINAFVPWLTSATVVANRGIAICKNTAPAGGILSGEFQADSGQSTAQSCSWTGQLNAGDKIYLYVFSSGADDIRVSSGFGACFLGLTGFAI